MNFSRRKSYTLIELVMVMTIVAVLAGISVHGLLTTVNALSLLTVQANLQETANVVLTRMSKDIRRLRNDRSIVFVNNVAIWFLDVSNMNIVYFMSGSQLRRSEFAGAFVLGQPIADNLSGLGLELTYFDDDGNVLATPAVGLGVKTNIRRIQIRLTVQSGTSTFTAQTTVRPRNLRHESHFLF